MSSDELNLIESPLSLSPQENDPSRVPASLSLSSSSSATATRANSEQASINNNNNHSTASLPSQCKKGVPSIESSLSLAPSNFNSTSSLSKDNSSNNNNHRQTERQKQKVILNGETLKDLQQRDSESQSTSLDLVYKFLYDDSFTDFEKTILRVKPNDVPVIQKFAKLETFPLMNHPTLSEITLSTIYSDHPLREFHKRSVKKLSNVDANGLKRAREQLNKIEELPLLFFLHGLGGQLSQLEAIIQEFRNCADIFGIDLPGFGNSKPKLRDVATFNRLSSFPSEDITKLEKSLEQMSWEDYKTDSIVDIIYQVLANKFPNRKLIIVAHSMGCNITMKLVNRLPEDTVESVILLAPPRLETKPVTLPVKLFLGTCNYFPRLFDFYRMGDRKGGLYSRSVNSYIYPEPSGTTDDDIFKRLTQLRWNLDTDSTIFLKYASGYTPLTEDEFLSAASKIHDSDKLNKILICHGDSDTTLYS
ncbi:unnamed protein product [Ambrosiozyma monospora]|uniref:Unnamed protein product n=1 Tax=Ambrosiozyma monospora TaxID=43982 RepID=A0A9W7DBL5_AMBMO|nr:unnamed protein product [Ambrosiozyma monospora]